MWFSVVCTLIDNDTRHSGQNFVDSRGAATISKKRNEVFVLTIENTDSDLKVPALHYANELLVRVKLSFQKPLQTRLDSSTDHEKPHFDLFFTTISTTRKMCFSELELEKALRNTLTRAVWYGLLFTTVN